MPVWGEAKLIDLNLATARGSLYQKTNENYNPEEYNVITWEIYLESVHIYRLFYFTLIYIYPPVERCRRDELKDKQRLKADIYIYIIY